MSAACRHKGDLLHIAKNATEAAGMAPMMHRVGLRALSEDAQTYAAKPCEVEVPAGPVAKMLQRLAGEKCEEWSDAPDGRGVCGEGWTCWPCIARKAIEEGAE